ncbi:MAG: acyloxyacyl hydrolase [Thiobacillus sp.]|nr:acyloxyacyl hydrolase [Thiobacillus sp.]
MRDLFPSIRSALTGALFSVFALSTYSASVYAQSHPADRWEVAVEAGYLEKIRNNTPLDYVIVPVQVAWRSPAMFDLWNGKSGARLTVRNRIAVILETYLEGAEDYYFGFAGAPSFELWAADRKSALFFEIGGGAGLTNSKNTPGGQGQDFTFNWFSQLGLRYQFNKNQAFTAAGYFTHHSNLGMTDPNPGIDVLGLNLGMVWQFD